MSSPGISGKSSIADKLARGAALKAKLRERRQSGKANMPPLLRGISDAGRQRRENRRSSLKIKKIEETMKRNLAREKWLAQYKPLSMGCPMLGRRVSIDAVSEWAAHAWDCDGLGFAWKCIQK